VKEDQPMQKKNIVIAGIASLVAIAATAFFVVSRRNRQKQDQPPKNAPQVPINNPGDQSNFPAGPTSESELG
jgi:hypothetical protein